MAVDCVRCGRRMGSHATAWVNGVRVYICPQSEGYAVSVEGCEWVRSSGVNE